MKKNKQRGWTPLKYGRTIQDGTTMTEIFSNATHTVMMTPLKFATDINGWVHLSIRRNDRAAESDWRIMQRIKNELVGQEREAVQIFPCNSRIVDEANQYHLWVAPVGNVFDLGYMGAIVVDEKDVEELNEVGGTCAKQRAFEPDDPALEHRNNKTNWEQTMMPVKCPQEVSGE